ncbi:MAG: transcriptional repressor LexA [Thermoleophilia bacterium]|nr:transcriptional repressor LexA [Thermoleophilia bacterium]
MFGRRCLVTLTERQQEILAVIEEALATQGYPPTVREIAQAVGLSSPASVHGHLRALEAQGFLKRKGPKRRALEVVRSRQGKTQVLTRRALQDRLVRVPLVGRVAAGSPVLAEESVEDYLEIPRFLASGEECFALRVSGDSMVKAGILDGDIVVVRRQEWAQDGDIVVALLSDEATLKRFFREGEAVRLQPENDHMEPIVTREPRIIGRVIGVLRKL